MNATAQTRKPFDVVRAVQIAEAQAQKSKNSSALLCASDARRLLKAENFDLAHGWALRSLQHSVGIFSRVYKDLT